MRLKGMVGDSVSIRRAGSGWRPPDYITNPRSEACFMPPSRSAQKWDATETGDYKCVRRQKATSRGDPAGSPSSETCVKSEEIDVELGVCHPPNASMEGPRRTLRGKRIVAKREKHQRRKAVQHRQMAYFQRVLALVISIFVGLSLLGMVATLLSAHLDAIETKLEERSADGLYSQNENGLAAKLTKPLTDESISHRRLLQMGDEVLQSSQHFLPQPGRKTSAFLKTCGTLARAFSTLARVSASIAEDGKKSVIPPVANVLLGDFAISLNPSSHSRHRVSDRLNGSPPYSPSSPSKLSRGVVSQSSSLQTDARHHILDMLHRRPVSGFQIPQSLDATSSPPSPPQELQTAASVVMRQSVNMRAYEPGNDLASFNALQSLKPTGISKTSPDIFNSPKDSNGEPSLSVSRFTSMRPHYAVQATPVTHRHDMLQARDLPVASIDIKRTSLTQVQRPEAIEMWEIAPGKRVCRTYRVCSMQDGSMLLPHWMEQYKGLLETDCGLTSPSFVLSNNPGLGDPFTLRHDEKGEKGNLNLNREYTHRDAFGTIAPREHMPHFVSDILKPLVSLETLFGRESRSLPLKTFVSTTKAGNGQHTRVRFQDVRPVTQFPDGALNGSRAEWVLGVTRLFENLGFQFIPAGREKANDNALDLSQKGTCFRSIVTNNLNQHMPYGLFDSTGSNVLFSASGLSREDVALLPQTRARPCSVTITALTRKGPRALLRLPQLQSTIHQMASQLGIAAKFQVVDFSENVPFTEQVAVMQSSNVLIATHGAGNSNFIFLRPGAAVIEIFPFSYRAGPFKSFARIFGLDYTFAMAAPQTEVFKECMKRHEKKEKIKDFVFSEWDKAVELEKSDPGVHRLQFETEFGEPGKSEGMTTRQCARMQELEFDITRVSSIAVGAASQQCQRAMHADMSSYRRSVQGSLRP